MNSLSDVGIHRINHHTVRLVRIYVEHVCVSRPMSLSHTAISSYQHQGESQPTVVYSFTIVLSLNSVQSVYIGGYHRERVRLFVVSSSGRLGRARDEILPTDIFSRCRFYSSPTLQFPTEKMSLRRTDTCHGTPLKATAREEHRVFHHPKPRKGKHSHRYSPSELTGHSVEGVGCVCYGPRVGTREATT